MTTITSAPRKEITAKRSVRPIGGDMDEGFGEIDRYSQNEMSPKGRDLVEKTSIVRIPLPDRGQVTGIGRGIEVSYKPLETPSSAQSNYEQPSGHTKVPDAIARDLADVNFDLISAVTSDIKKDVMKVSKKGFGALLKGVSDFFTVNFQSVKEAATSFMEPAKKEKQKTKAEIEVENKKVEYAEGWKKQQATESSIASTHDQKEQGYLQVVAGGALSSGESAQIFRGSIKDLPTTRLDANKANDIFKARIEKIKARTKKTISSAGAGKGARRKSSVQGTGQEIGDMNAANENGKMVRAN